MVSKKWVILWEKVGQWVKSRVENWVFLWNWFSNPLLSRDVISLVFWLIFDGESDGVVEIPKFKNSEIPKIFRIHGNKVWIRRLSENGSVRGIVSRMAPPRYVITVLTPHRWPISVHVQNIWTHALDNSERWLVSGISHEILSFFSHTWCDC